MKEPNVNSWDAPVVDALDRIEALPGAGPDRVEWAGFRFFGTDLPGRPMDRVTIAAFPAGGGHVTFRAFADGRFEVTRATSARARAERPAVDLAAADLPEALGVPAGTAARTVALIKPALHSALRAYNDAHAQDPAAWRRTQQVNPGPLPRVTRAPAEVPVRVQQARAQDDQHHLAVRQPQHGGPRL